MHSWILCRQIQNSNYHSLLEAILVTVFSVTEKSGRCVRFYRNTR
uniref:Uncharacterized protein n=1 Tax=Onchocerca volvulus TaxID=6282 RepID=A0A8R1TUU8_ONCVO